MIRPAMMAMAENKNVVALCVDSKLASIAYRKAVEDLYDSGVKFIARNNDLMIKFRNGYWVKFISVLRGVEPLLGLKAEVVFMDDRARAMADVSTLEQAKIMDRRIKDEQQSRTD